MASSSMPMADTRRRRREASAGTRRPPIMALARSKRKEWRGYCGGR